MAKSDKEYIKQLEDELKQTKIELKTSKLRAGAPFSRCFGAIFMPLRSVMPVLAAFRAVLLFSFLCSVKKLEKLQPKRLHCSEKQLTLLKK